MRERGASAFLCNRKFLGIPKRPRSARECAKAHSFLLKKSVLDKKPPGGKIDSSAWRLLKHQKYCFVWEKCDYSASFA